MSNTNYEKYLKYKLKYLELKNELEGGNNELEGGYNYNNELEGGDDPVNITIKDPQSFYKLQEDILTELEQVNQENAKLKLELAKAKATSVVKPPSATRPEISASIIPKPAAVTIVKTDMTPSKEYLTLLKKLSSLSPTEKRRFEELQKFFRS